MTEMGAATETKTPLEDARYLLDLVTLRRTLRRNELDCLLARPGGANGKAPRTQILYMLDANVLLFGIDPPSDAELTQVFQDGQVQLPRARRAAVAVITAAHLFSGRLPGQGASPLFIDPGHWKEFLRYASRPEHIDRLLEEERTCRAVPNREARIIALARSLRDADKLATLKDLTGKKILEEILDLGLDRASGAEMSRRLLKRVLPGGARRLRSVTALPYLPANFWTGADTDPEIGKWRKVLAKVEEEREHKKRKSSDALDADAAALARLGRVNAYFQKEKTNARLVLITTDDGMHEAVARQQWPDDNIRESYLRRLTQYIPLLNMKDMANGIDTPETTEALREALDARLLQSQAEGAKVTDATLDAELNELETQARHGHHRIISMHYAAGRVQSIRMREALGAYFHAQMRDEFTSVFDHTRTELLKQWTRMVDAAAKANYALLVRFYRESLAEVVEALEAVSEGDRREIGRIHLRSQRKAVEKLTRAHLEASLLTEMGTRGTELWARCNLGVRLTAANVETKLSNTAQAVLGAMRRADWVAVAGGVAALCDVKAPRAEVSLAAAAVALQGGLWETAGRLASYTNGLAERHEDELKEASKTLTPARAKLISAMAARAELLTRSDDPVAKAAVSDAIAGLPEVVEMFDSINYWMEAAEATAELAAMRIAFLVAEDASGTRRTSAKRVAVDLGNAATEAADAIQAADLAEQYGALGLGGAPLAIAVRARAASALVMGSLVARAWQAPTPMLMRQTMLTAAAGYLDAALDRDVPQGTWAVLAGIARHEPYPRLEARIKSMAAEEATTTFTGEILFLRKMLERN